MGKGANKQLLLNAQQAQGAQKNLFNQASSLYGFLDPTLVSDVTDPQGYSTGDLTAMNTASQQSLGGSTAGITGQANLEAARTRNAGGFQGAIGEGSRAARRQLSQNAVGIQQAQANAKLAQRSQAIQALMNLYGIDQSTALNYLNSSNSALGAENAASGFKASWFNPFVTEASKTLATPSTYDPSSYGGAGGGG